ARHFVVEREAGLTAENQRFFAVFVAAAIPYIDECPFPAEHFGPGCAAIGTAQTRDGERPRRIYQLTLARRVRGTPKLAVVERKGHRHRHQENCRDDQESAPAAGARVLHQDTLRKLSAK